MGATPPAPPPTPPPPPPQPKHRRHERHDLRPSAGLRPRLRHGFLRRHDGAVRGRPHHHHHAPPAALLPHAGARHGIRHDGHGLLPLHDGRLRLLPLHELRQLLLGTGHCSLSSLLPHYRVLATLETR